MGEYDKLLLNKNDSSYKRRLTVRIIAAILLLGLMAIVVYKMYPYAGMLKSADGREYLKSIVDDNRLTGAVTFTSLQALQVIIGILPPLQIFGGVLFGILWGMILSVLGIFIGSAVVFFLVKLIGYPLVQTMFSDKKITKFKFLSDEKKVVTVLAMMYLVPGFPKDLLTYIVPLTRITKRDFFLAIMPARIPAIIMSSVVGGSIRSGNYIAAAVFSVIVIVLSALGIIYRDRIINRFHSLASEKNRR